MRGLFTALRFGRDDASLPCEGEEALRLSIPTPYSLPSALLPIPLIFKEVLFIPCVQHSLEEHPAHLCVTQLAKASVGGQHTATDDAESAARDAFGEKVVLREESALVEAAETYQKASRSKSMNMPVANGFQRAANVLHDVVADVQEVVEEAALAATNAYGG